MVVSGEVDLRWGVERALFFWSLQYFDKNKGGREENLILEKIWEHPGSLPNSPLFTQAGDLPISPTNKRFVLSVIFSSVDNNLDLNQTSSTTKKVESMTAIIKGLNVFKISFFFL